MASVQTIRDGLKARLATISGLRTFDTVPDSVSPPAAIVGGPERIDYGVNLGSTRATFLFPIRLFVGRSADRAAQDKLDGYLASTGATSVKVAIEADKTLGGAANTCKVRNARNYGPYQVADVSLLGVEFVVEVFA